MDLSIRVMSLLGLLGLWTLTAVIAADPQVLPTPLSLLEPAWTATLSGELPYHLSCTVIRVAWAFALAMSIGVAIGLLMGLNPKVDQWLDPWLVVFLNLPALVLIVLCYLWIGLNETAAIIAVTLNKIPNVVTVIREGARTLDPGLRAMALVFHMPLTTRLRHVILPQMAPFIAGAARSGLAVIWKIVLVVEFLGRSNGIGFQVHLYFQLFDVTHVLIYAFAFIAVMLAVEWTLLQPWERRTRRWRTA